MEQHRRRTIVKTVSWRIIATIITVMIVFFFTGKIILSIGIGFVEVTTKMFFYYMHERVWDRVYWGKKRHPLSSLAVKKQLEPPDMETIKERLQDLGYID